MKNTSYGRRRNSLKCMKTSKKIVKQFESQSPYKDKPISYEEISLNARKVSVT